VDVGGLFCCGQCDHEYLQFIHQLTSDLPYRAA
jgi:hypothetical protein